MHCNLLDGYPSCCKGGDDSGRAHTVCSTNAKTTVGSVPCCIDLCVCVCVCMCVCVCVCVCPAVHLVLSKLHIYKFMHDDTQELMSPTTINFNRQTDRQTFPSCVRANMVCSPPTICTGFSSLKFSHRRGVLALLPSTPPS